MSHPLNDMMGTTIEKIGNLVDANTVLGDPIHTPDGITIIPVSAIKLGLGSGGSDFVSKHPNSHENPFGGAAGAGVSVTPVAFLILKEGSVRVLPVAEPVNSSVDRLIELIPELTDRISALIRSHKEKKDDEGVLY